MVLWIGVDDTDSVRGMCTTFLATEIVRDLTTDHDLIGYPRLVRLNPNIPWKTRGNGALCVSVGKGRGRSFVAGKIEDRMIWAYPHGVATSKPREILKRIKPIVEKWSDLAADGTDPGLVVLARKPSPGLYWEAVRGIVGRSRVEREIRACGEGHAWKSGRGLVGATAACAWRPRGKTWEVLAYRDKVKWGTPRIVSAESVRNMDAMCRHTFNNYDYENDRVIITPRSPCPVLFGVRGYRPTELRTALRQLQGERPSRWMIFLTNQATDDHVLPGPTDAPRTAGRFLDVVVRPPVTIHGGHVVFGLGSREVTAYEPSKQFRAAVRALAPGDFVEVVGSVRDAPRTINLEKFRVIRLAEIRKKMHNPVCIRCGAHMKSSGRRGPFRCRHCGGKAQRSSAIFVTIPRSIDLRWYAPPPGSRRHLSQPVDESKRASRVGSRSSVNAHLISGLRTLP